MDSEGLKKHLENWLREVVRDHEAVIDHEGFFVEDYGHHRGGTHRMRRATDDEIKVYNSFRVVIAAVKQMEEKERRVNAYWEARAAGLKVEKPKELA